jgi:hypothetical protein
MEQKPGLALKITGWIVVVLAITGSFFKIQHWPGSGPFIILTNMVFLLFYLPFWLGQAWHDKKERIFIVLQFLFTFLFSLSSTFKIMHWPGGSLFYNLLFLGGIFVLLPVSAIKLFRFAKTSVSKFNNLVLLFFLITYMQTSLMRNSETNVGAGAISFSSLQAEKSYKTVSSKSKHLYMAFDQLGDKEQNGYYKKAQQLKTYADSIEKYLHAFKVNIIRQVEQRDDIDADTISIAEVRRRTESKIPTAILVGDDPETPIKGRFSGTELKSVIDTYRDSVIKYADDGNRSFIASGINLNTDDSKNEEGEDRNWITENFYNLPTITVLITLTNIETEVKNAETQVLTNLLNNASHESKDNLATKIADLSLKLEDEKRNREFENLQKDKELSQLKIGAKNKEIAQRDNTIAWFVFITLAFVVMVFFIIRSNFIRRRINKQLEQQKKDIEHQKQLIEEKQKEILDSIYYARRIQRSLLANERYIERNLKQL